MNGKRFLCGLLCLVLLVGLLPAAFATETGVTTYTPRYTQTFYKPKYTLTFETNGGTSIRPIKDERGRYIYLGPFYSTRDGYTFDGWYRDKALTDRITEVIIDRDKTIYAAWKFDSTNTGALFQDVHLSAWYAEDVTYVYNHSIMRGTSSTTFSPDADLTRAMLITILYRMVDSPAVSEDCPFPDVQEGFYGETPITWAWSEGIINGFVDDGAFHPNSGITREEMAVVLYRCAEKLGFVHDESGMILQEYDDSDKISDYATEAMRWALHNGILNGVDSTTLDPQGIVSRAQGAAILHRMNEYIYANTK